MMNNIASGEYQIDTMLYLRAPRSVEISFSSNIFLRSVARTINPAGNLPSESPAAGS